MTTDQIRERILQEDVAFVLSKHRKLRTLYALKKEIRYELERHTEFDTESVAEHIFGMHCLCDYFLPLDERLSSANQEKIRRMIQYHDVDEIRTGDIACYHKNDESSELIDAQDVITILPKHLQAQLNETLAEYHEQMTIEAKFVKALDKVEPILQCYDEEMKKVLHRNKVSLAKGMAGDKQKYMDVFPVISHFNNVIAAQMEKEGFFDKG